MNGSILIMLCVGTWRLYGSVNRHDLRTVLFRRADRLPLRMGSPMRSHGGDEPSDVFGQPLRRRVTGVMAHEMMIYEADFSRLEQGSAEWELVPAVFIRCLFGKKPNGADELRFGAYAQMGAGMLRLARGQRALFRAWVDQAEGIGCAEAIGDGLDLCSDDLTVLSGMTQANQGALTVAIASDSGSGKVSLTARIPLEREDVTLWERFCGY